MIQHVPLSPRDPASVPDVVVIGRGFTDSHDLEDFRWRLETCLGELYDKPLTLHPFLDGRKGSRAASDTLVFVSALAAAGAVDLVITDHLSRLCRRMYRVCTFIDEVVKHGARVICLRDGFDTADEAWRQMLIILAHGHGRRRRDQ